MTTSARRSVRLRVLAVVAGVALAGCSAAGTAASPTGSTSGGTATGTSQVLPVASNPITNTSTVQALKIDSVLVENNVDPATGSTATDHLEIALKNTGAAALSGVEIYYTFTDPAANASEGYFAKLPDTFTVPPGGARIAHFDETGAPDHFPVNKFSLYYTSKSALVLKVMVSAKDAAVQETTVKKDAGGAEVPGQ